MKRLILILMLLAATAQAGQTVIGSADLPYTAATAYDTITFDASKITTTGSGIYVTANNVTVDLQDDTLEFGTNYGDNAYGIYTSYHRNNLNIVGDADNHGLILHGGGTSGVDSSYSCRNVRTLGDAVNINIQYVDMEIYGWNAHNFHHFDGYVTNLTISDCRLTDHGSGFTSRCSFDGSGVHVDVVNLVMHDVYMDCYHNALYLSGSAEVYNCTLLVDAKNDLYYQGDPWDQVCYSSVQAVGISCWHVDPGTSIHDNVFLSGVENEGCDGAFLVCYTVGTAEDPVLIYNNEAMIHRGPDDHYGSALTAKGYKQRWGNKHINIYDNLFTVIAHNEHPLYPAAYNANVEGFDMLFTDKYHGSEGDFCDSFITVENNHVLVIDSGNGSGSVSAALMAIRGENTGYNWNDAGNVWRNNYFVTSNIGIDLGDLDGGKCINFLSQGDTIVTTSETHYAFDVGTYDGPCTTNVIRDVTYTYDSPEDSIRWAASDVIYANGSDITFERTLRIYVEGSNELGVESAACSVWSDVKGLVYSGLTNSSGYDTAFVPYNYTYCIAAGTPPGTIADTNYNDFTIKVAKSGSDSTITMTINSETDADSLGMTFGLDVEGEDTPSPTKHKLRKIYLRGGIKL